MIKVYVQSQLAKTENGNLRKPRLWATFKLEIDANNFADNVKKHNPTWYTYVK